MSEDVDTVAMTTKPDWLRVRKPRIGGTETWIPQPQLLRADRVELNRIAQSCPGVVLAIGRQAVHGSRLDRLQIGVLSGVRLGRRRPGEIQFTAFGSLVLEPVFGGTNDNLTLGMYDEQSRELIVPVSLISAQKIDESPADAIRVDVS